MLLNIITPEKTFFSGEAEMVVAPGVEGEFGVMAGHMPFISLLKPGVISVERDGEPNLRIAVIEGVAEANPEGCLILAQNAQALEGISAADAAEEIRVATQVLDTAPDDAQKQAAEKRLLMAQTITDALR